MPRMTINEIKSAIEQARESRRPFVVRFEKADGEMRVMTCTTSLPEGEFVKGTQPEGQRKAEDEANNLATVFSIDVFQELVGKGTKREVAGRQSWRRIPFNRCHRVELL